MMTKDNQTEQKSGGVFEIKAVSDTGVFSGYASVFGLKDDGYDIVDRGAFAQTLADLGAKSRKVPVLWAHNPSEPMGVYTSLKEDEYGLLVEGKLNLNVNRAKEIHSLMADGAINGLSIGYRTKRYEIEKDPDGGIGVRRLKQVDLFEISVVTFPMLDAARVDSVKQNNAPFDPRAMERELKDAGFSNGDAVKAVAIVKKYLARDGKATSEAARDETATVDILAQLRQMREDFNR